jgi:hypothetical protein
MHARPRSVRMLVTPLLMALAVLGGVGAAPAAAGWLGATDLAPSVGAPVVAMARDSTAFVAFTHSDGANTRVAALQRSPGGAFGAVRDLSPAGENSFNPALAVDRQGNATIAWLQVVPSASVIKARFRPAGGDWGATQTVSTTPGVFDGPSIAVGDNGGGVVAWGLSTGGSRVRVQAAVRPAGSPTFGAPLFASPDVGTQLCQPPHVAMDADGDVAAIWTKRGDDPNAHYRVQSSAKAAGATTFEPATERSTTPGDSPCNSDIQMTPGGRVTAVWDASDNVTPRVVEYADRGTPFASGNFGTAVKLSTSGIDSGQPHLALDDQGNGAATWLANDQLQSAVRTGLGGWTAPKPLSGLTSINGSGHALAAAPNGDAIVAFVGTSNGSGAIFGARRRTGTEFGEITPVATLPPGTTTESFSLPAIALDDQGNGFAVWDHSVNTASGTVDTAQVAAYDAAAPAITGVSVPATGTAGQAVGMSATASDRMSGAALHFDFGDGSGADGGSVQHTYGAPGTYTVSVLATDAAGNQSRTQAAIQIAPAPATPGGGGNAPTGPKGPQRVAAVSALSYDRLANGNTRLRTLVIDRLSGPETVQLACVGKTKGCRKKANHTTKKHGRKLVLTKYVKGMTLKPKAQLTIKVSRPGFVARIFRYTMVKRKDPKKATRCLSPGQKKSVAC